MFLRHKRIGKYTYVYLVESVYQDGRTRQHIIRNLGRREDVEAGGDLERLAASAARLSRKALVLSAEARGAAPVLGCRRIGPGLIFERLWRETGCQAVIEQQAEGRKFGFAVERAVFLTVLHRLMVSGSDRAGASAPAVPGDGVAGRAAGRRGRGGGEPALREAPDRGGVVRPPPRPVLDARRGVHGHRGGARRRV